MKFLKTLSVVIAMSIAFSSCGVMFGGSRYNAQIVVKNHPDAIITANGNEIGKGAALGSFKRNTPLTIQVEEDGCKSKSQTFDNTLRGGNLALSFLMWGLVGVVIDLGTGASYKPDHHHHKEVTRTDEKNFLFTIDYSGCPSSVDATN